MFSFLELKDWIDRADDILLSESKNESEYSDLSIEFCSFCNRAAFFESILEAMLFICFNLNFSNFLLFSDLQGIFGKSRFSFIN